MPLLTAVFALVGVRRVFAALFDNRHYHFTALRWGRPVAWLIALGAVLKLLMQG